MTTTAHVGSPATVAPPRRTAVRVGRGLSWFFAAFLTFDAVIHILNIAPVVDGSRQLGFDVDVMPWIGVLELALVVLYVVPRTAVLGAVLLTGYLGGAFCAQLRIEAPVFSTLLFPIYVGVALWVGLWLRDGRVRNLV
jgi:hypothetical protein